MSPELCSKVLRTAGKPRHLPLRQSRPCQPRACFLFVFQFELTLFSDGQLNSFSSTHHFQLGNVLSLPYLGNVRNGPSPSRWPALIKFPRVWRRLCDVVLFPSCLVITTPRLVSATRPGSPRNVHRSVGVVKSYRGSYPVPKTAQYSTRYVVSCCTGRIFKPVS